MGNVADKEVVKRLFKAFDAVDFDAIMSSCPPISSLTGWLRRSAMMWPRGRPWLRTGSGILRGGADLR